MISSGIYNFASGSDLIINHKKKQNVWNGTNETLCMQIFKRPGTENRR
jgi:hypothetical protein